jgi:hypothetical protein
MEDTLEQLKQRYRRFADDECGEYGALYFKLSHAVALDFEILRFIAQMTDRQPNLFFAAVHYLAGSEKMPLNAAELRVFVRRERDAVAAVMCAHHTQTNEVGRCAVILPALPKGPLALIEVGTSAGLCLMLDKYRYDYGSARIGDPASPVVLRCLACPWPLSWLGSRVAGTPANYRLNWRTSARLKILKNRVLGKLPALDFDSEKTLL